MRVLALDTSTEALSVALSVDGHCRSFDEAGGPRASQRLLPLCAELLRTAGLQFADLDLIGMGAGPGAFTGLRTAASAAQGLAYALHLPVARVDTLMAQAETAFALLHSDGTVLPDPVQAEPARGARGERCAHGRVVLGAVSRPDIGLAKSAPADRATA
jgi:Inactive homolog of metal-dependent proteases, putative molecular chaperone